MAGPAIREIAVDTMYHVHKTSVDWEDDEIAHIGRLQTGLVVCWRLRTDASLPLCCRRMEQLNAAGKFTFFWWVERHNCTLQSRAVLVLPLRDWLYKLC